MYNVPKAEAEPPHCGVRLTTYHTKPERSGIKNLFYHNANGITLVFTAYNNHV